MIVLNEEQAMLREMASGWVADRVPVAAIRNLRRENLDTGFDPAVYAEMAEMGWPAILVPEDFGGVGLGITSLGLIAEELGRNLVTSPLVDTGAGAVSAILLGDNDAAREGLLPAIAEGSQVFSLAIDDGNHNSAGKIGTHAAKTADGWTITGTKRAVPHAGGAHAMIVLAALEDGTPALFSVPTDASGVELENLQRIDSRGAANVRLSGVAVPSGALLGTGADYVDAVLDRVRATLAAEMLGGAVQAFETTVDYMKTRIQFDQPIGSFQALQHRVAELLGELVLARAAVYGALEAIDNGSPDAPRLVSLAKATAGDTFRRCAREMIQLHGGIGMTDEHDAGLYLKRAHTADHTLGNVAFHRERYASFLQI